MGYLYISPISFLRFISFHLTIKDFDENVSRNKVSNVLLIKDIYDNECVNTFIEKIPGPFIF